MRNKLRDQIKAMEASHNALISEVERLLSIGRFPNEDARVLYSAIDDVRNSRVTAPVVYVDTDGTLESSVSVEQVEAVLRTVVSQLGQQLDCQRADDRTNLEDLVLRYGRVNHRMGELWAMYQGKGWPDEASVEFKKLREEDEAIYRCCAVLFDHSANSHNPKAPALTKLLRQTIYGDFCGDNTDDLKLALEARSEAANMLSRLAQSPSSFKVTVDRSDAVNLARNVVESDLAVTAAGVRTLCDGILRMDHAIIMHNLANHDKGDA